MKNKILLIGLIGFSSAVFADIKTEAIEGHNYWRNQLNNGALIGQPTPVPFLQTMTWNDDLAARSQVHSNKCVWEHSGVGGENLYAHTGSFGSMSKGVDMWVDEHHDYSYKTNKSINGGVVGHYTQVVWAKSTEVGCAKTACPMIKKSDGSDMWGGVLYTCQYKGPGNYYGQKPYSITPDTRTFAHLYNKNLDVDIPFIVLGGFKFRVKLANIDHTNNWDFRIVSYELLGKSSNTNFSTLTQEANGLFLLKIQFNGVVAYLSQIDKNTLDFRLVDVVEQ